MYDLFATLAALAIIVATMHEFRQFTPFTLAPSTDDLAREAVGECYRSLTPPTWTPTLEMRREAYRVKWAQENPSEQPRLWRLRETNIGTSTVFWMEKICTDL